MKKISYRGTELLPPKSDLVFKAIFGREDSKDILAAFLRDVLDLDIESGDDLELVNTELPAAYEDGKLSRLDVRIKTRNNEHIDVEIQLKPWGSLVNRSLFYECTLFVSQLKEGMDYGQLGKAITLVILDYTLFNEEESYYNTYKMMNTKSHAVLSDQMEITFLELKKLAHVKDCKSLGKKEKWALFLSAESEEVLDMLEGESKEMEKAVKKLVYVSAEEKLRYEYDMRDKAVRDYNSGMFMAEQRGIQIGKEQGIEQGREQQAIEAAKSLKRLGIADAVIMEATGLSEEVVRDLSTL